MMKTESLSVCCGASPTIGGACSDCRETDTGFVPVELDAADLPENRVRFEDGSEMVFDLDGILRDDDQVNRLIANEVEYSGPEFEPSFRAFVQDAPNHIAAAALGVLAFVIFTGLLFIGSTK